MTIRAYTSDDLPTVQGWARARGMEIVPELLSKNGFMVEDVEGPICAAWCYLTFDCPRASIDDFHTRPEADGTALLRACRSLERVCVDFLLSRGYSFIYTFADERLSSVLSGQGWVIGAKPHVHAIKTL